MFVREKDQKGKAEGKKRNPTETAAIGGLGHGGESVQKRGSSVTKKACEDGVQAGLGLGITS